MTDIARLPDETPPGKPTQTLCDQCGKMKPDASTHKYRLIGWGDVRDENGNVDCGGEVTWRYWLCAECVEDIRQGKCGDLTIKHLIIDDPDDPITDEKWIAICKEEGLKIDPATAEVDWGYGNCGDPYELHPTPEEFNVSRVYFARRPGSELWVEFSDLPEKTREALRVRHEQKKLAFPDDNNSWFDRQEPAS